MGTWALGQNVGHTELRVVDNSSSIPSQGPAIYPRYALQAMTQDGQWTTISQDFYTQISNSTVGEYVKNLQSVNAAATLALFL